MRHLIYPQKWNKYAYVQNNPLSMKDPDGADDYFVFRPLATTNGSSWNAIKAEAPKYGNTVTVFNGKDATAANYTKALQTPGAHVVDAGHAAEYMNDKHQVTAGSVVLTGNEGIGVSQPDGGTLVPVSNVSASSVAVFGCYSADLANQYNGTTFTNPKQLDSRFSQEQKDPLRPAASHLCALIHLLSAGTFRGNSCSPVCLPTPNLFTTR